MSKRVLCLLAEGFEEIETVTPVDLLRRAGAEVVLAALGDGIHCTGRCGIVLHADARLADIDPDGFDLLLLPGGPGVQVLRADGRAASLARDFAVAGRGVAAICAAPLVLHDAGLLAGRAYTAHDSTREVLDAARGSQPVVVDGTLVTSRGAGTALEFGLALIDFLFGAGEREKVARAVMA
jgi:4-methyl-5(b-hydroxyethyl)-thiazole monophosphate biosynthesis